MWISPKPVLLLWTQESHLQMCVSPDRLLRDPPHYSTRAQAVPWGSEREPGVHTESNHQASSLFHTGRQSLGDNCCIYKITITTTSKMQRYLLLSLLAAEDKLHGCSLGETKAQRKVTNWGAVTTPYGRDLRASEWMKRTTVHLYQFLLHLMKTVFLGIFTS